MTRAFRAFLVALSISSAAMAQTVTQGTEAQKQLGPTEFKSPMTVETTFAAADRKLWGTGKEFSVPEWWELGKYSCDGVYLRSDSDRKTKWDPAIKMRVKDLRDGSIEVRLELGVMNPKHNRDRRVNLKVEAVTGEKVLAEDIVHIAAKDNGEGFQDSSIRWKVPLAEINAETKLRITMTTETY